MRAPRRSTSTTKPSATSRAIAERARRQPRADGDPDAPGGVLDHEVGRRQRLAVDRSAGPASPCRRGPRRKTPPAFAPRCATRNVPSLASAMPFGCNGPPSGCTPTTVCCAPSGADARRPRRASPRRRRRPTAAQSTHSGRRRSVPVNRRLRAAPAPRRRSSSHPPCPESAAAGSGRPVVHRICVYVNGCKKARQAGGCVAAPPLR